MPSGQTLGNRAYFAYTADDGSVYSLQLDETLGLAAGLTPDILAPNRPINFKPRYVLYEGVVDGKKVRKRLVCNSNFLAYNTDQTATTVIDGVGYQSTGRVGEKLSYPRNPPAPPAP